MSVRTPSPAVFRLAGKAAETVGDARTEGGQPVQRFRKELIRVGSWVHPADGSQVKVTHSDLEHWADMFSRMHEAGVMVPVPAGHTNDPEKNRGKVTAMSVEGDALYADIDLIGEDAIKLAGRVEVSIFVPPEIKDGRGNSFPRAIEHVALVTDPVIPGQKGFQPIAASRGKKATQAPVYRLAAGGEIDMEWLKKLAAMLGIATDGLDEAGLQAAIEKTCGEVVASKKTAETELSTAKTQVATLQASRGKPIEIDDDVIGVVRGSLSDRLDGLVEAGAIGKPNRDKLAAALCLTAGSNSSASAVCLSKKAATAAGFGDALALTVLDALKDNKPAPLGERTGSQTVRLSRETPGAGTAPTADEARKQADEYRAALGIKPA